MEEKMLYKDASQPVEARVEDLLSRMTLEEKAAQLCGDLAASFIVDGKLSHEALVEKFKDGHGRITQYSLVGLVSPKQIAEITNQLQDFFVNETRLGIPVALQSENLCGYPGAGGTLFPAHVPADFSAVQSSGKRRRCRSDSFFLRIFLTVHLGS